MTQTDYKTNKSRCTREIWLSSNKNDPNRLQIKQEPVYLWAQQSPAPRRGRISIVLGP